MRVTDYNHVHLCYSLFMLHTPANAVCQFRCVFVCEANYAQLVLLFTFLKTCCNTIAMLHANKWHCYIAISCVYNNTYLTLAYIGTGILKLSANVGQSIVCTAWQRWRVESKLQSSLLQQTNNHNFHMQSVYKSCTHLEILFYAPHMMAKYTSCFSHTLIHITGC